MKKYFVGIDSGSTMCKLVLFDGENIVDFYSAKTGWNPKLSSMESLDVLLKRNDLCMDDVSISATGYGRDAVEFAEYIFTEITCHAFGALFLSPDICGVVDIGGQDSKVILLRDNRVINFLMNDKCAAGTGRFLSMACDTLGIDIDRIDEFTDTNDIIHINSMCTVFAESEIIGSLSMQKDRRSILTGVLHSIAQKIRQMTGKLDFDTSKTFLMTGGLSRSNVLMKIISEAISCKIISHEYSLYAGAVGACICAVNK